MKKHLEIKTAVYKDIEIRYKIDYDLGTISIVEKTNDKKSFIFWGRGLEYMNGWVDILDAMKHAIKVARKDLQDYQKIMEKYENRK